MSLSEIKKKKHVYLVDNLLERTLLVKTLRNRTKEIIKLKRYFLIAYIINFKYKDIEENVWEKSKPISFARLFRLKHLS